MSKQQRRKGNAKNASSASAHGYLADGGAVFVGLTPEMNIFEVASSNQLHQMVEIDDETRIVMKKLTKKDALTREKGLKELMVLIQTESTEISTAYEHFCGLVAQLATDGSPTVRQLTMKSISLFLVKLKKAATKGLKKIIPMVLFAKSDVTNGVAAAASGVLRDGFEPEKKGKIIEAFGPMAFEMAANIAQGAHELCVLKEYDATEDKAARTSRLETQSLNVFLSFIREHPSEMESIWKEPASKLFGNSEFIKKTFSDPNKTSLKVQLLSVSYKFPVDLLLSLQPMLSYIQNTLDAQTFTQECSIAWEGLILLMGNEQFQSKVSLMKTIFPRILNVIRKKGTHWRVLKHSLLPAVVVLLQELAKNQEDGIQRPLTAIMESFTDNLPWSTDISMNSIHCWFHTFADFVRWILTNGKVDLVDVIAPLTVKMSEQSMLIGTSESTESISELIFWMIERINEDSSKKLCELLEQRIFEAPPEKSALLRNALTAPGKLSQLSELHAHLLSSVEDFSLIRNLAHAHSEEYFNATIDLLKDFNFLQDTKKFEENQAADVVLLISKILSRGKYLKIHVENDAVGRQLLLSEDDRIWTELFRSAPSRLFQEMSDHWHQNRNGRANAKAVSFLKRMGIELDTKEAAENVDFLISLLRAHPDTHPDKERKALTMKLFAALFESEEEPKKEHFECLVENLNNDEHLKAGDFFDKLFNEEIDTEHILELAERLDRLGKSIAEQVLSSKEEQDRESEKLHFLELDVFTYSPKSHVLIEAFSSKIEHPEEQEAMKLVKFVARKTLFDLASQYHSQNHQLFGYQTIEVIRALQERYCLKQLDEEMEQLKEEIEKKLKRSDDLRSLILESRAPNFLVNVFGLSFEQERTVGRFGAQEQEDELSEKIETLFSDSLGLKYLETVFTASQTEKSFELFTFNLENNYEFLANLLFVKQFIECGGAIFTTENFELRDFALCGIVSVLDNSADVLAENPNAFDENPRLEAITANYMELFCVLNAASSEQSFEEWDEFYAPTIRTYFIRMFRSVRKEQQPTPFIRSLLKVLFSFSEFPAEVPNDDAKEFVPELAVFKYPQFQESCISQAFALMRSDVEHIQVLGYAVARLLMPIMFKQENASALQSSDETSVSTSRVKLNVPVMLRVPTEHHRHLNALLFDLALLPLSENEHFESFSQEHRVAYCDAIIPLLRSTMNCLLVDQPFDFMKVSMSCKIPKNQEREYYLESDLRASPVFFQKFASRLLFKSLELLPAAVRLYYKGMANTFTPMFAESVTRYASRLLIDKELAKVKNNKIAGEMKVRTVPVTGEIIADYVVDETKMKLTIGLPADYPLSVPSLTIDNSIVRTDRAKKWLLQLNAYLFHQNGAILEGIEMWKRNVDKGVEGAEECCICMMTVHQTTHQLPKIKCKQCNHKFHSNCLYKWFETSTQSTCPLCRNNFT